MSLQPTQKKGEKRRKILAQRHIFLIGPLIDSALAVDALCFPTEYIDALKAQNLRHSRIRLLLNLRKRVGRMQEAVSSSRFVVYTIVYTHPSLLLYPLRKFMC